MQPNFFNEIPCKCAQKFKKYITRYGESDEYSDELAIWNNLFELEYKIKLENLYSCILLDFSTVFINLSKSEACMYQLGTQK